MGKTTGETEMRTIRVKMKNGRTADIENAVGWDDDDHRAKPHVFVYGENGRVLASWPYADVAGIEMREVIRPE